MNPWQEASDKEKGFWLPALLIALFVAFVIGGIWFFVREYRKGKVNEFKYEHEQRN